MKAVIWSLQPEGLQLNDIAQSYRHAPSEGPEAIFCV